MKSITVYSANAGAYYYRRLALHPVLDGEFLGQGGRFPCRVIYARDHDIGDDGSYLASCRSPGCTRTAGSWVDDQCEQLVFPDFASALTWLLEGERPAQRRKKRGRR